MNQVTYDDFSQDYDLFVDWESRLAVEMPFIEKHLKQLKTQRAHSLRVLDAACGSGMHTIEIAKRGYSASGADLSPKMIHKAIGNARDAGVNVNFQESTFGNLAHAFKNDPGFPFDLIICLGNSLPHLLSLEQIQEALIDFANCMSQGGLLILQNRNFNAVTKNKDRWIEPKSRRIGKEEWIFLRFYDFDSDGLITFNIVRLHRTNSNNWQQRISITRLYPLMQNDLARLMRNSGFSEISYFGIMDEIPFNPSSSENLVVVARKV